MTAVSAVTAGASKDKKQKKSAAAGGTPAAAPSGKASAENKYRVKTKAAAVISGPRHIHTSTFHSHLLCSHLRCSHVQAVLSAYREKLQSWLRPILRRERTAANPNPKMNYKLCVALMDGPAT